MVKHYTVTGTLKDGTPFSKEFKGYNAQHIFRRVQMNNPGITNLSATRI